jgi:hypothetical protein
VERGKRGPQKTERGIIIKKAIVITLLVFGLVVVCSVSMVFAMVIWGKQKQSLIP